MKVSYNWLQEYIQEKLPPVEEVVNALTMHSFEIEGVEDVKDDKVLDVKVLPNRSHDCLSHYGIASEIASVIGLSRQWLMPNQPIANTAKLKLKVSSKSVNRQKMVLIEGVEIKESPKWLKEKLAVLGHKSINSVVDITNYLTFALGQPMHAFDAGKIYKDKNGVYEINIREAVKNEKITLLNGTSYTLQETMIVIADKEKTLDVAGVMGGKDSCVTKETKDILLSFSGFDAVSIRKTAKTLGIRTDASQRFENMISSSLIDRALPYALKLISEISGGVVDGGVEWYPNPEKEKVITINPNKISNILGVTIDIPTIIFLLGKQRITAVKKEEQLVVTIPLERLDLNLEEDIAEEVGRLYGLDKVLPKALDGVTSPEVNSEVYLTHTLRQMLISEGFSEIYAYAFTDMGDIEIENPLAGDKKFLRSNLLTGMDNSLENNFKYLDLIGMKEIKLFEIGKVFTGKGELLHLSIGIKYPKGKKNADLDMAKTIHLLQDTFKVSFGDVSIVGGTAEVDLAVISQKLEIPKQYPENFFKTENKNTTYKPISPYPFAVRDVAVFVPNNVGVEKVDELVKKNLTDIVFRYSLFDAFTKEGKTSYAFRIVFQSKEKTLTDEEINVVMNPIYEDLKKQEGFEIR